MSEHTPSDFPLADLTQEEVDHLESRFPALENVLPLAPLQLGLLFHSLYDERGEDVYTVQLGVRLQGDLDPERMRGAVLALTVRHPTLRARFVRSGLREPAQVIAAPEPVPWQVRDLRSLPAAEQEAEYAALSVAERRHRFRLDTDLLLRLVLVRTGDDEYRLLFTSHHLTFDGWSSQLMVRDLLALYEGGERERDLPAARPYEEYLAWLDGQDHAAAVSEWRQALDALPGPSLVGDGGRTGEKATSHIEVTLTQDETAAVTATARSAGLTVNSIFQGAWAVVLGHLTGSQDVVFGTTVAGRPTDLPDIEQTVGVFINTLPVRVDVHPSRCVEDLFASVQDEQARLLEFPYVSLSRLQDLSGHRTLFDTIVVYESYPVEQSNGNAGGSSSLDLVDIEGYDATDFPMALVIFPGPAAGLRLNYRQTSISDELAQHVLLLLRHVLTQVADRISDPVGRLVLPAPDRAADLLALGAGPELRPPQWAGGVGEAISRIAERCPEAVAVRYAGMSLRYAELDASADALAKHPAFARVPAEGPVLVLQERSPQFVVSALAVAKSGGALLPVAPGTSSEHLRRILAEFEPAVVLTDRASADHDVLRPLLNPGPTTVIVVDGNGLPPSDGGLAGIPPVGPEQLIGISPSSGPAGSAEPVGITHADLLRLAADPSWVDRRPTVLMHSPHDWDALAYELWVPLLQAGEVVLAPPGENDLTRLGGVVRQHGVTRMRVTAGVFGRLSHEHPQDFSGLAELWTDGGPVPQDAARRFRAAAPGVVLVNCYGLGETAGSTAQHRASADDPRSWVPIGRPLTGRSAYVLDAALRLVPAGVTGELYVSGAGLARGHIGRSALTAQRFVADPFAGGGARMYRTGDLVRWGTDGLLEFVGSFSLITNGKADRAALPAPDGTAASGQRPRTRHEQVLCEAFANALGLESVGINADFFELGGYSIAAMRLSEYLRRELAIEVRIRDIFEAPTPGELAARLAEDDERRQDEAFAATLPLRHADHGPAVFCLHPVVGLSWGYAGLLQFVPPRIAVYGLQSQGLSEETDDLPGSVDELLTGYLDRIRRTRPHGPYVLLGWSFGGMVAQILAARLQEDGERVLLVVLDAAPDAHEHTMDPTPDWAAKALLGLAGHDCDAQSCRPDDPSAHVAAVLAEPDGRFSAIPASHLPRVLRVTTNNIRLTSSLRQGRFDGESVLFLANRSEFDPKAVAGSWQPYLSRPAQVHYIDATHDEMTDPAPMAAIGKVLAPVIERFAATGTDR